MNPIAIIFIFAATCVGGLTGYFTGNTQLGAACGVTVSSVIVTIASLS